YDPRPMLTITELTYRIGGRTLLAGAAGQINAGWKVGLVGRNGSGKSTLLDLILGRLQPDGGSIALQRGLRVGFVEQEAPGGGALRRARPPAPRRADQPPRPRSGAMARILSQELAQHAHCRQPRPPDPQCRDEPYSPYRGSPPRPLFRQLRHFRADSA